MGRRLQAIRFGVVGFFGLAAPPAFSQDECPSPSAPALQAAIEQLNAPIARFHPTDLAHRIDLLNADIWECDGPNPAPALFRLFLRSRYGIRGSGAEPDVLPEDPDLFERALRTLAHLPAEKLVDGVHHGLAPGLIDIALERLRQDWWLPASEGLAANDRQFVATWQPHETIPTAVAELATLLAQAPDTTLHAMSTGGGSLVNEVVMPVQDALFAAAIQDAQSRPAVLRALCGVVADGAPAGPEVAATLATLQATDPDTAASITRARDALGTPARRRPIQLPTVAPGRLPGSEALTTATIPRTAVITAPSERRGLGLGWHRVLVGMGLALGAMGVAARGGQRRRWLGPLFGVGLLCLADGLLDITRLAPPASDHPLFQFIAQSGVDLRAVPGEPDRVYTGGGSMRHTTLNVQPPADRHRVVFLGASSVHGSHYLAEEAFPARVAAMHPQIEAINFGIGGATSAGVAAAGRAAFALAPDALVVMYGHNEVAQFTRLAAYNHTSPTMLRVRLWLSRSALYRQLVQSLHSRTPAPASGDLYRSVSPERAEVADLTELAVQHLRLQLGGLLAEANENDTPVVVVLPPTNLRFAHLEAFDTPGPGDAADLDRLRRQADDAARVGDGAQARMLLQQAIDRSASPREMVSPIRQELLRIAHQHHATVIDAAAWMTAHAPDGVTPSGLFWDDVHPTADGHERLAELIGPVVLEQLRQDSPP